MNLGLVSMLLTRDHNHGDYEIHAYTPGKIVINETTYEQSVLIGAHQLEIWKPQRLEELAEDNFQPIFAWHPDIVLFGTGEVLTFPDRSLIQDFYVKNIGIEVMSTIAACRTFNVLMSEGRNVVAALLIR